MDNNRLGAAFFGFTIGAVLFGITILQAYQYFVNYARDSMSRKATVLTVCLLDALHLVFAVCLMYSCLINHFGKFEDGSRVVWSLKAQGTVQVLLIVFVQSVYLSRIWILTSRMFPYSLMLSGVKIGIILTEIVAVATASVFLYELYHITVILGFSPRFEFLIYVGFGVTSMIDFGIAVSLYILLRTCDAGTTRSTNMIAEISKYIISTGMLTSFSSLLLVILYASNPYTLTYFAMEFSITRLYANSMLAFYNASHTLRRRVEQMPSDLKIATAIIFGEPESMIDSDRSTSSNTEDSDGLALNSNISDKIYSDRYSRSRYNQQRYHHHTV